mmetsp:Transcript_15841/g.27873  ORF Transcript_15841/g.27873 Transcript_15841/m.27873 type:complete len:263 (+) Transcript_15841:84-872(+)
MTQKSTTATMNSSTTLKRTTQTTINNPYTLDLVILQEIIRPEKVKTQPTILGADQLIAPGAYALAIVIIRAVNRARYFLRRVYKGTHHRGAPFAPGEYIVRQTQRIPIEHQIQQTIVLRGILQSRHVLRVKHSFGLYFHNLELVLQRRIREELVAKVCFYILVVRSDEDVHRFDHKRLVGFSHCNVLHDLLCIGCFGLICRIDEIYDSVLQHREHRLGFSSVEKIPDFLFVVGVVNAGLLLEVVKLSAQMHRSVEAWCIGVR